MKNKHIESFGQFNENLNISDVSDSFLQTPCTIGDLKKFINNLPDEMSVNLISDNDGLKGGYVKVINTKLLNKSGVYLKHPISGEDFDTLVVGF